MHLLKVIMCLLVIKAAAMAQVVLAVDIGDIVALGTTVPS
jgi:hypothetical protein